MLFLIRKKKKKKTYIIWGTKYAKLFENYHCIKGKVVYTLERINKWLEETAMSLKVKRKYLITLTVILVIKVIPKLLILLFLINFYIIQLAWEPLHVDFDVESPSVTESFQKKEKKIVTLFLFFSFFYLFYVKYSQLQ